MRASRRQRGRHALTIAAPTLCGLVCAFVCTVTGLATAQTHTGEVRLDQLQPPSPGSPFTRAEGPFDAFDSGIGFGGRLSLDYAHDPLTAAVNGGDPNDPGLQDSTSIVSHALLMHIGASLTPLQWLHLELSAPFALHMEGSEEVRVTGQRVAAGEGPAIGDMRVGLFVRPHESREIDLAFGARFWAPWGSTGAYLSGPERKFRAELTAAFAGEQSEFLYGCTLGIAPTFFGARDGDRLGLSCAAHFKLAPMLSAGLEPHAALFSYAPEPVAGAPAEQEEFPGLGNANFALQIEPLAAVTFQWEDLGATLAAGPGFGGAPGTASVRAMFSISYAARGEQEQLEVVAADRDLDGVADDFDACPDEAGSKAQSGCPGERDEDGDGITTDDACPSEAGAAHEDPAANGCPDSDNDRLPDPLDPCPKEPSAQKDGCPRYARLEKGQFVVQPEMSFYRGRPRLRPKTKASLLEIIATMRANPDFKQLSIIVGIQRSPQRLVDLRAKELLALLDEQNVDKSRFEVVLGDELASGKVQVKILR